MPLLLAYLKSVPTGNTQHLAKACYALENFVENLGSDGSVQYRGGEEHIGFINGGCRVGKKCEKVTWAVRDPVSFVKKLSHRVQSAALPSGTYGVYAAAPEEPQQSPDQGASRERHRGHW